MDQIAAHHSQNEEGQLIAKAIEAHGGHEQWLRNEVLEFRWIYHMNDRGPNAKTNTLQRVDTSTLEAVNEIPNSDVRFGWTGKEAWVMPPDAPRRPTPRFWGSHPLLFYWYPVCVC